MFKNLNASAMGVADSQSEVIEQALTYRFSAMDLDIVDFANRAKLHGMPYARRLIDSSKVSISTFKLPFSLEVEDDVFKEKLACLDDWASAAAELGCSRCVTTIAPAGDRLPYHENFNVYRDRFAEVCKVLQSHNIRLGIGFRASADLRRKKAFQFIHELEALALLVNMVNLPNIGINLDVWDLFVSGGSIDSLRALKVDQLVAVELADAPEDIALEELTESSRLLPHAEGRFNVAAVLVALAEMGYEGPVAVRPHRSAFASTRNDAMAKALSQSLNEVWKEAGLTPKGTLAAPTDASVASSQ